MNGTLVVVAQATPGNRNGDSRVATTRRDSHISHSDSDLHTTNHGITKVLLQRWGDAKKGGSRQQGDRSGARNLQPSQEARWNK